MPRRLSRKSENMNISEKDVDYIAASTSAPKKGRKAVKVESEAEEVKEHVESKQPPSARKKAKIEPDSEGEVVAPARMTNSVKGKRSLETEEAAKPKQASAKRKAKDESGDSDEEAGDDSKTKKKRKTKEEKEAESMPLAARTSISTLRKAMHIGAHVSAAKGVQNSITNALNIGGNAFALFLKSQRKWTSPPLAPDARDQFKAFCKKHNFDAAKHVLPHGSYLVNLAQKDAEKANQAYTCFLDDLQRCEALGINLYNFHPGNTGSNPRPEAISRIAAQLNKAHKATKSVVTVLENMAGSGNVIGSTWEDLRDIIALVDDKTRVGVCIDTCHSFAAGYDLRSPEAFKKTMDKFASTVGLPYLKALHLNDSKAPFSSHRDLHANIGTGFLGLRAFHNVVNFEPFQDIPMVLETPIDKKGPDGKTEEDRGVWAQEIKLLESLIGCDPESEAFKADEQRLQDSGAEERKKLQGQADKKQQKTLDSMLKKSSKQQMTLDSMFKKSSPRKRMIAKNSDAEDSDDVRCDH
ncbi:xylose isomerase-like protein [Amylocarpus encephaloides]|uniref:Apurinic-apyrimidinic endonuclease 1 n=1 Tax=Amylocarpus encephaloides TaxID=45428 RepID=A0A9P7YPT8_9HELO|nr:xylose isomerase-like protein [Amylocarpus encephaloides]